MTNARLIKKIEEDGTNIEIKGSAVKELSFVASAIPTDETRYYMNVALFEDDMLIGTDGHRLHTAKFEGLSDLGFENKKTYRCLKKTKSVIWFAECNTESTFPNWRRVIPDNVPKKTFSYVSVNRAKDEYFIQVARLIRNLHQENALNINYLNDLPVGYTWDVTMYGKGKPFRLDSGGLMALIMPMNMG